MLFISSLFLQFDVNKDKVASIRRCIFSGGKMTQSILKNSILFCFEASIGQNGLSENAFNNTLQKGEHFLKKWQNHKDFPLFQSLYENQSSADLLHAQEKDLLNMMKF